MRYIVSAMAMALLLGGVGNAEAQFVNKDRSTIRLCPQELMPGNYPTWTRAGVQRLIPELLNGDVNKVHWFFSDKFEPPPNLNASELQSIVLGRVAASEVLALFLFTPGMDPKLVPNELPEEFRRDLDFATQPENLIPMVLTCGSIINGMSYGTRGVTNNGEITVRGVVIPDAIALGWSELGVEENGKPGVRVWAADVPIKSGHNAGKTVRVYIFAYCGNISYQLSMHEDSKVTAPMPSVAEAAPSAPAPGLVIPAYLPPPVQTAKAATSKSHGFPCIGKRFRWYCLAPLGLAAFAIPRDGQQPPVVSALPIPLPAPGKVGGAGDR